MCWHCAVYSKYIISQDATSQLLEGFANVSGGGAETLFLHAVSETVVIGADPQLV